MIEGVYMDTTLVKNDVQEEFFKELDKKTVDSLVEKYCGTSIVSRVRRKIYKMFTVRK